MESSKQLRACKVRSPALCQPLKPVISLTTPPHFFTFPENFLRNAEVCELPASLWELVLSQVSPKDLAIAGVGAFVDPCDIALIM